MGSLTTKSALFLFYDCLTAVFSIVTNEWSFLLWFACHTSWMGMFHFIVRRYIFCSPVIGPFTQGKLKAIPPLLKQWCEMLPSIFAWVMFDIIYCSFARLSLNSFHVFYTIPSLGYSGSATFPSMVARLVKLRHVLCCTSCLVRYMHHSSSLSHWVFNLRTLKHSELCGFSKDLELNRQYSANPLTFHYL